MENSDAHDLATEIAVLKERLRGMDTALSLQADEYDRRLDELNHAHEEAVRVQQTYVTEEVHRRDVDAARTAALAVASEAVSKADSLAEAVDVRRRTVDERVGKIESFQARLVGALALITVLIPTVTAMIVYLLSKMN